jgi:hypothetical protein
MSYFNDTREVLKYGQSPDYFGGQDYEAAKAKGISDVDIFSFLEKNPGYVRNHNAPGGGGLYDRLRMGTEGERLEKARQESAAKVRQEYEDKMRAASAASQAASATPSVPTGQSEATRTGTEVFNIDEFAELLNRLESSKGRQQRQKSLEGRRDIFAQGLASMMSNF